MLRTQEKKDKQTKQNKKTKNSLTSSHIYIYIYISSPQQQQKKRTYIITSSQIIKPSHSILTVHSQDYSVPRARTVYRAKMKSMNERRKLKIQIFESKSLYYMSKSMDEPRKYMCKLVTTLVYNKNASQCK